MTIIEAARALPWRPNTLQLKYLADLLDCMTPQPGTPEASRPSSPEYLRLWLRIEDLYRTATGKAFLK